MSEDNKISIMGDWYLGTDGLSFVLLKKRVIQDSRKAKQENIGKEQFDTMGYYATLGSLAAGLHRYMSMEALMKSNVSTLEDYIAELDKLIGQVRELDQSMVDRLRKQMGADNE